MPTPVACTVGRDGGKTGVFRSDTKVCNLVGVHCSADSRAITEIDLSGQDVYGTLPGAIGSLTSLELLSISDNAHISGTLPTELGLTRTLSGLGFARAPLLSGTLPIQLGRLTNLCASHERATLTVLAHRPCLVDCVSAG